MAVDRYVLRYNRQGDPEVLEIRRVHWIEWMTWPDRKVNRHARLRRDMQQMQEGLTQMYLQRMGGDDRN